MNNNPKIEVDIAEIFGEIKQELKGINDRLSKIELGQEEIKGEIEAIKAEASSLKEQVGEIKGSQKAQLWSLIVILATAVLGVLVAAGKILFF